MVNEAFEWTRIAYRKVYVYFQTTTDTGDKIRSSRITIPATPAKYLLPSATSRTHFQPKTCP